MEILTDRPERRFAPGATLYREGEDDPLMVVEARPVADGPGWWLRIRGIDDRAAAQALVGTYLEAATAGPAELGADEVWWHEVIGVAVTTVDGRAIGTVEDIYRAGGAEVLVVRGGPLGELDLPNVTAVIREFDPRSGRIVADLTAFDSPPEPPVRRPRGRRTRRAMRSGSTIGPIDRSDGAAEGPG